MSIYIVVLFIIIITWKSEKGSSSICIFTAGAQSSQEWAEPKPGSAATWSAHQQEGRSEAQYLELNQAMGCCLWPPQAMTLLL